MTEVKEQKDCHPQLEQLVSQPLISQKKTCSKELMGPKLQDTGYDPNVGFEAKVHEINRVLGVDDNLKANDSAESPPKVMEDEPPVSKLENNELGGITEIYRSERDSNVLAGLTVLCGVDDKKGEADDKMAPNVDSEANLTAELPIGILEEWSVDSNEQTETEKLGISGRGKARCNMVADATSSMEVEDVAKLMVKELPAHAEPEVEENLPFREARYNVVTSKASPTESEDVAKIVVEELPEKPVDKIEENPPCREARYHGVSDATSPDGSQDMVKSTADELLGHSVPHISDSRPLPSTEAEDRNNAEVNDSGGADVNEMPSPELPVTRVAIEDSPEAKEDEQWQVVNGNKGRGPLDDKIQCLEPDSVIETDKIDEPNESEITTEKVLVSTPSSQMSINETDMVIGIDKKLIEDNAKGDDGRTDGSWKRATKCHIPLN